MGDYDELARRAEHGGLTVKPGTVRRGPEAAEAARTALMAATGATTAEEATRIAVGRPALGREGESPVVRARVPQAIKDQLHQIAQTQHRKESEIVREAVIAYIRLGEGAPATADQ
ncbi:MULTISPECIES: hypothetical protein [Kocuria]|uniref:hypothetical protein n=1 Tax=Kocuria TaxID=57493 RepID=UPI00114600CD|nr:MULTISPECIES: hypothetical protein [Kocuria]